MVAGMVTEDGLCVVVIFEGAEILDPISGVQIDDLQNQDSRMDATEIFQKLFGVTVVGPQVCVRDDHEINGPLMLQSTTCILSSCTPLRSPGGGPLSRIHVRRHYSDDTITGAI